MKASISSTISKGWASKSSYSSPYISPLPPPHLFKPTPNHPHSYAPDAPFPVYEHFLDHLPYLFKELVLWYKPLSIHSSFSNCNKNIPLVFSLFHLDNASVSHSFWNSSSDFIISDATPNSPVSLISTLSLHFFSLFRNPCPFQTPYNFIYKSNILCIIQWYIAGPFLANLLFPVTLHSITSPWKSATQYLYQPHQSQQHVPRASFILPKPQTSPPSPPSSLSSRSSLFPPSSPTSLELWTGRASNGPGRHSKYLQRAGQGRTSERAGPKNSGPSNNWQASCN